MKIISNFHGEYRFLSNFYPSPVEAYGNLYRTVEHAFQACKTEDLEERKVIANLHTPGQAKQAGQKVKLRPDWEVMKPYVMKRLLVRKFAIIHLGKLLLATGYAELVEGNTWKDTYWGVCKGVGKNILGKTLMEVRTELGGRITYVPKCCICGEFNPDLQFFQRSGSMDLGCAKCLEGTKNV